jgi:hypothetical protein
MELVFKAEFSIVTRASKAWIPELIAAAGPKLLKPILTLSPPRFATETPGRTYARACRQFFDWCAAHGLELTSVRPFHVAAWKHPTASEPGSTRYSSKSQGPIVRFCHKYSYG